MGFSVSFPSVNKANQVEYVLPDNTTSTVEEALNNLYTREVPSSSGTQSDVLLGQLFFSSHNTSKPGLCYSGQTYSWSNNPKLKELFDSQGHDFIVDNLDGNFTVVDHTDFIRAGVSNIGTHIDDTTAPNGMFIKRARDFSNESTAGDSRYYGEHGAANEQTEPVQGGGTETAPDHRTAYFGIYGDLAVVLLDTTSVEVLDEDDFASNSDSAVSTQQATKAFLQNSLIYNNQTSGLTATNYQDAIDELASTSGDSGGPISDYFKVNSTGPVANASGSNTIAIGENAKAIGNNSLVIGYTASTQAYGCILIGDSSTSTSANDSVLIGNRVVSNGGFSVGIGKDCKTISSGVAVGANSEANARSSISIGSYSRAEGTHSQAIGGNARAIADQCTQLGAGTNNEYQTLQFKSVRLANNEGLYTSFTTPTNYTPTDNDNVTSHFQAIDVALANAGGSFYRTNRENISANKQLQTSDPNLQLLKNESGGTITVNLPTSPVKDSYFLIASRKDSIGPINVNTITLSPGDRLELIYDGTEWFPL